MIEEAKLRKINTVKLAAKKANKKPVKKAPAKKKTAKTPAKKAPAKKKTTKKAAKKATKKSTKK